MTPNTKGEPLRLAHQEILEEKQSGEDYVVNVLLIFYRIIVNGSEVTTRGEFEEDTPQMDTLQTI